MGGTVTILPGANPRTFKVLGSGYGVDDNYAYSQDLRLDKADIDTFEINEDGNAEDKNYIYRGTSAFPKDETYDGPAS